MNIKPLLIIAILIAAGYYAIAVKHFNPFAATIEDDLPFRKFDETITSMKDIQGENGTIIIRLSTWCPHCIEQLHNLYPITEPLQEYKLNVVAIVEGPDKETIKNWSEENMMPWSWKRVYWHDGLTEGLNIKKEVTPYVIFRDRNKKQFLYKPGFMPLQEIIVNINKMLATYEEFKDFEKPEPRPL